MAILYPGTSVSGYNANPPPDDGTTVPTNLITWAGIKTKLADPLNTFDTNVDSNITTAFGKTVDGASVVSSGVSYNATAADQGRLIIMTGAGTTLTVPPNSVGTPFIFALTNASGSNITLSGNSPSQVDLSPSVTVQAGGNTILKFDGTNWYTVGGKSIYAPSATTFFTPDIQVFTSGSSATYTAATNGGNRALYLRVRMIGGGGGGGAQATNAGGNGGDTSFSGWTALHGSGGGAGAAAGGAGGSGGANGTGILITRLVGASGQGGGNPTNTNMPGAAGGSSPFGGAGAGVPNSTGGNAQGNTGSGGAGGGSSSAPFGSGGGAGEYAEFIITSPAATYTYTVGTAGSGGAAGTVAGGNGGSGRIEVIGYWQ